MSCKVNITHTALKNYEKLNEPYKTNIKNKIDELSKKGLVISNIKALSGQFKGLYRLRVGNYRIIFDKTDNLITILSIIHRKNAYK